MFKKMFKKKDQIPTDKYILVAALLVNAARIDNNYSETERKMIKKTIIDMGISKENEVEKILINAERKEKESNQIVEFTREIKKNSIEFRLKIIEILWKIVYSDGTNDIYETNLIRRVCGLLYISDKDSGIVKLKVKSSIK